MSKKKSNGFTIEEHLPEGRLAPSLSGQANYLLALYYYSRDKYKKSLEEILIAIEKEEQRWDLYEHLVSLGKKSQNLKAVYEKLNSSLNKHPDNSHLHSCLGLAYLLDGKLSEAIEEFQNSVNLNSDLALPHFLLGVGYLECICSSDLEREKGSLLLSLVEQEFSKAKEEDESIQTKGFEEGMSLLSQSKYQQALREFKQALNEILRAELAFGSFEELSLYNFLAPQMVDYEMVQKAIRELDQRMEKQKSLSAHNRLGMAYLLFLKLLFQEAKSCFEQASKIAPRFQKPLRNLKFLEEQEEEFSNLFEFLRF